MQCNYFSQSSNMIKTNDLVLFLATMMNDDLEKRSVLEQCLGLGICPKM